MTPAAGRTDYLTSRFRLRTEERSRIAGEMHDVLAHKVSLLALQAGGLEVNPDAGTEVVQRTAALIGTTAMQALEDLRDLLGLLRSEPRADGSELAPQPDFADLGALIESSRAAGVQVRLEVVVQPGLPAQLGRTAYRIVPELKHRAARCGPGRPGRRRVVSAVLPISRGPAQDADQSAPAPGLELFTGVDRT